MYEDNLTRKFCGGQRFVYYSCTRKFGNYPFLSLAEAGVWCRAVIQFPFTLLDNKPTSLITGVSFTFNNCENIQYVRQTHLCMYVCDILSVCVCVWEMSKLNKRDKKEKKKNTPSL